MNITLKIAGVDVSSYVISSDVIPIVKRNRDWSLVVDGFTFAVSKAYTTVINVGDRVEVFKDGAAFYLGTVLDNKTSDDNLSFNISVQHFLMQLDTKLLQYSNFHTILNDTSVGCAGGNYTVDATNNYILKSAHGLSIADRIQFKSDAGGVLAGGLEYGHYYWVIPVDANKFRIYANYDDYIIPNAPVDITGALSGSCYYSKVTSTEINKYNDHSAAYYFPTFSMSWLFKNIFRLAGCTLDDSLLTSYVMWSNTISGVDRFYTFDKLVLAENMFWCLGMDKATNHVTIDDTSTLTYKKAKMTVLTLLEKMCGIFGFAIAYTGNNTYKIFPQARYATGYSHADGEPLYAISTSDKIEYGSYLIEGDKNGWIQSRKYNSFLDYMYATEAELIEHDISSMNDGNTTIEYLNSLRIFLRSPTVAGELVAFGSDYTMEYPMDRITNNAVDALIFNFGYERIVAPLAPSIFTVKELNVDIENQTMEIIQETNTLETY